MNVRPIDGAALYKAFREELKKHPVPETPGLGRYRAVVWQEAASVMIALLMKAPTIDVKPATYMVGNENAASPKALTDFLGDADLEHMTRFAMQQAIKQK